jgi:5-oxoprolinase (ATP-hydrolysing)
MISVWVDVGGTFADCLVHKGEDRCDTKVLSSGLVRAAVVEVTKSRQLRVQSLPASAVDDFWRGAKLSILSNDGLPIELGIVQSQVGLLLTIDQAVPAQDGGQAFTIELDAGLESVVLATRLALGVPLSAPLPPLDVRMGTTRGTNALLTRGGAKTSLLVTAGFADVLRIGDQTRPDLFALSIRKLAPLTESVVEVSERLDAKGALILPLDRERLRSDLLQLKSQGVESLAICFLHAHVSADHEIIAETMAREIGFTNVSRSSEVAPLIKLVSRAETTTLDAYLNPILDRYVARIWQQLGGSSRCRLRLMTSAGNLVAPAAFRGRDSILSGPAGGVVALGHVADRARAEAAIGLDMGGTSTDVSRFEGHVGRRYESRVAGVRVLTPMMDIETVAAGGGSICLYRDGRLTVGPHSAGADPGPACYGRGGPLTITDVNLLLGRIPASRFPFPLDHQAAAQQLENVFATLPPHSPFTSVQQLAEGFLDIAVTHMAEAVRTVSTAQGSDVRSMALVGFGGAAGQHLCRIAAVLGMQRILDHPDAGVMSALGMGWANVGHVVTRGVYRLLSDQTRAQIEQLAAELQQEATECLRAEGDDEQMQPLYRFDCDLRYQGTEAPLALSIEPPATLAQRFHDLHGTTFGYARSERAIELVAIRCEATLATPHTSRSIKPPTSVAAESTRLWQGNQWIDASLIDRAALALGDTVNAPAMIVGPHSTLLIELGWQASVITDGIIEVTPVKHRFDPISVGREAVTNDPILLEVMARRFQGIADAMGEVLRRTSISVNVKERRDYSCAVFRGDGSLVANAPHVPVHLGAMGHTVRHLMAAFPVMSAGDCYLSNDPFAGGSHLPDVTAVTPVFCSGTHHGKPDFFVASRAHHAEIGGRTPGSMPPDATSLAEEGVVIRKFALVQNGRSRFEELRELLSSAPYPSRCVDENLADVAAQQAAGAYGARAIVDLATTYSAATIDSLMERLLELAGDTMQRWIQTLSDQPASFADALDDGTKIGVAICRQQKRLSIEFQTSGVHPHGFNATPAIVTAAVLYVLRCVSGSNLPLCDGVLRDVDLKIPAGLLDPPAHDDPAQCAAVVAGNVETSQRVVDVLLGALGVAAASQGTMNNLLMGDASFGYYETIGGGSGATCSSAGADAVHTHMTNTRITDPEVLESRLPVRLWRFAIRADSGGPGTFRGGHGMIREFEFLRPLIVSLITGRRTRAPYGIGAGGAGKCGINRLTRSGNTVELPPTATFEVGQGDRLTIETPGGGGWS